MTPLEATRAELERQAQADWTACQVAASERGEPYVRVSGHFDLAALVEAVLAADQKPADNARPLAAACAAIARTKAGDRTIADHVAHGLYYWRAHDLERSSLTDLALFEAALACLQEYLLRQPQTRTAQEMLGDLYPPESRSPGHR